MRSTDEEDIAPLILALGGLRAALQIHADCFEETVSELGIIQGKPDGTATRAEAYHDFLFYCFTRCGRGVRAITILLDCFLAEETYVLARSVYEHYLALACVQRNPHFLDEFLAKPIGLYAGRLEHPRSKKGTPIRRTIVHKDTGATYPGIASFRDLAGSTGYKPDLALHDILYPHLSEHAHPNMLASGDYRDASMARYTVQGRSGLLKGSFWACLCSSLALGEVRRHIRKPRMTRQLLDEAHAASREALADALQFVEVQGRYRALPNLVAQRLRARRRS